MDILFLVKKILSAVLMPFPFGFIMLLVALIILGLGYRRFAKGLGFSVLVFWYILSIDPIAKLIASPLEYEFPKYQQQSVAYVIVLGGYHNSDERFPISSLLSKTSLMRLSEGIRIYRANPGAKLLLSGYKFHDKISNAEAMSRVAQAFGVTEADIVIAPQPKDTAEEAAHWAHFLKTQQLKAQKLADNIVNQNFALVTSAMHIPRAVYLFQYQGLQPIPAPTAYRTGGHHGTHWQSLFPNANALSLSTSAWHEYLGKAWAIIRRSFE